MLYYKIQNDGTLKIVDRIRKKGVISGDRTGYTAIEGEKLVFSYDNIIRSVRFEISSKEHSTLTEIKLSDCPNLVSIAGKVPTSLKKIIVGGCTNLREMPDPLPDSLEELYIRFCKILEVLPVLPSGLKKLDASHCRNLRELPVPLPDSLEELYVSVCTKLERLPVLPSGLKKLYASHCENLRELPVPLPDSLEELYVSENRKLERLPVLPSGLKKLDARDCRNLRELPGLLPSGNLYNIFINFFRQISAPLPSNLEELNISECVNLERLPALPSGLKKLYASHCTNLRELPAPLPDSLEELNIVGGRLKRLPVLPSGLKELYASHCTNLRELPVPLPDSLEKLDVSVCVNLERLPVLPSGLKELYANRCTNLRELPVPLPDSLNYLNLWGCSNLQINEELISQFQALEARGCRIIYPTLRRSTDKIANKIDEIKEVAGQYFEKSAEEASSCPIVKLLYRFGTEATNIRGEEKIEADLNNILLFLRESPKSLKWMNQIAIQYLLLGCNNQPVAGVNEISFWIEVARAEGLAAKLEAGRLIKVFDVIDTEIRESKSQYMANGHVVGEMFEVELGNALKREIHKRLLSETRIAKPWPGIAENISHEASIMHFLTEDNINRLYQVVLAELFETDLRLVHEHLCERTSVWSDITMQDIVEIEKKKCESRRNNIISKVGDVLIDGKSQEEALSYLDEDEKKQLKLLINCYSDRNKDELGDRLLEMEGLAIRDRDSNIEKAKLSQKTEVENLAKQKQTLSLPRENRASLLGMGPTEGKYTTFRNIFLGARPRGEGFGERDL